MKKILKIILIFIIIIWILINILSVVDLSFFGVRVFRVGSGSMEPYLKVNDVIIIKMENIYKKNDVITFEDGDHYTTHRIVEIDGDSITTKGDGNNANDANITKDKIVGKLVYRFKIFGFLSYLLLKPFSWILIFVIGVFISIVMPVKKSKGKHMAR